MRCLSKALLPFGSSFIFPYHQSQVAKEFSVSLTVSLPPARGRTSQHFRGSSLVPSQEENMEPPYIGWRRLSSIKHFIKAISCSFLVSLNPYHLFYSERGWTSVLLSGLLHFDRVVLQALLSLALRIPLFSHPSDKTCQQILPARICISFAAHYKDENKSLRSLPLCSYCFAFSSS